MKEIKRGYRLTAEEEAILRGEIPSGENGQPEEPPQPQDQPDQPKEKQKSSSRRVIKTIAMLLIAMLLMVGIAKFFLYLIGGWEKDADSVVSDAFYFSLQKELVHHQFAPLSEAERVVFMEKLTLTPQEEELFWPEFYLFANLYEQTDSVHRKWVDLVYEKSEEMRAPEQAIKLYLSANKRHTFLIDRYSGIFSKILSTERMPWVFILHDRIRQERNTANQ